MNIENLNSLILFQDPITIAIYFVTSLIALPVISAMVLPLILLNFVSVASAVSAWFGSFRFRQV